MSVFGLRSVYLLGRQGVTCGCLWVVVVCAFETLSRGCLNPVEWVVDLPLRTVVGGRYTIQSIWFLQRKVDRDDLSSVGKSKDNLY